MGEGSPQSVSRFSRATTAKCPNLPNGVSHVPRPGDALYQFEPPSTFAASKAVAMADAIDPGVSGPKTTGAKLHSIRYRASAHLHADVDQHTGDARNQGWRRQTEGMLSGPPYRRAEMRRGECDGAEPPNPELLPFGNSPGC